MQIREREEKHWKEEKRSLEREEQRGRSEGEKSSENQEKVASYLIFLTSLTSLFWQDRHGYLAPGKETDSMKPTM